MGAPGLEGCREGGQGAFSFTSSSTSFSTSSTACSAESARLGAVRPVLGWSTPSAGEQALVRTLSTGRERARPPGALREAGRAKGSTGAYSSPAGGDRQTAASEQETQAQRSQPRESAPPQPCLSAPSCRRASPGLQPTIWAGASWKGTAKLGSHPRDGRPGGQTYLRSAEWAAMRFLRLLSARGQPERLKEKRGG